MNQVTENRITHSRSGDDVVTRYDGDTRPWFSGVVEHTDGDVLTVWSPVGSTGTDRLESVFHQDGECSECADA